MEHLLYTGIALGSWKENSKMGKKCPCPHRTYKMWEDRKGRAPSFLSYSVLPFAPSAIQLLFSYTSTIAFITLRYIIPPYIFPPPIQLPVIFSFIYVAQVLKHSVCSSVDCRVNKSPHRHLELGQSLGL